MKPIPAAMLRPRPKSSPTSNQRASNQFGRKPDHHQADLPTGFDLLQERTNRQ
jgi:hypothetical protein